jgi:GTP-binding protein
LEPYEDVYCDVPEALVGAVIEKLGRRKGEMKNMHVTHGMAHLHFLIPTRGLLGYRTEYMTDTKGQGVMNTLVHGYQAKAGDVVTNPHGSLVAHEPGIAVTYGMLTAQGRGVLFISPGIEVYKGMIVGENARDEDISVNICKEKKLSNMRSKGDGTAETLEPPRILSLEEALEYIGDDELVEVTPKSIRLRKRILDETEELRRKKGMS